MRRDLRTQGVIMKRILSTVMVMAALTTPGLAADLGTRTYTKAPVVAPVSNWSGFYVGGNLGYGWGDGNTAVSFLPSPADFGDNWQIGSLVTGLEADIQGSDIKGSARGTPTFVGTAIPDPLGVLSSDPK